MSWKIYLYIINKPYPINKLFILYFNFKSLKNTSCFSVNIQKIYFNFLIK